MSSFVLSLTRDSANCIRGMVCSDNIQVFSVYDFIVRVNQYKTSKTKIMDEANAARKCFLKLINDTSEYKDEIKAMYRMVKFPGSGQRDTPAMTIRGLQRLLMIIGGDLAREFRELVEGTFTRVMAGDTSLLSTIEDNAASAAPLQQVYRQALAQEPVTVDKRQMERDQTAMDLEVAERKQKLLILSAEAQAKVVENQKILINTYTELCPNKIIDERAKMLFKDNIFNIAHGAAGGPLLTVEDAVNPNYPITISVVAARMGLRFNADDLLKIGMKVAANYKSKYGKSPDKHPQMVGGAVVNVCSYTERDSGMLERVMTTYKPAESNTSPWTLSRVRRGS